MIALQDTRVLVTIQIVDDTQTIALMLAFATGFFALMAGTIRFVSAVLFEVGLMVTDAIELASTGLKLASIVANSLAYGLT